MEAYGAGHLVTATFVQQYCACKILSFSYSSGQSVPFDESYRLARAIDLFLKIDGVINVSHTILSTCDIFIHI